MADSITGSLFGGQSGELARLASQNEKSRQALIGLGLNQINSVFGGGTSPFYSIAERQRFTPQQWGAGGKNNVYYSINKRGEFAPYYAPKAQRSSIGTGLKFGGAQGAILANRLDSWSNNPKELLVPPVLSAVIKAFGGGAPSRRELVNSKLKKGLLLTAPEYRTFEGFQNDFFDERARAYERFALPQLGEQYRNARDATLFNLANRGLLNSSAAVQQTRNVERTADRGRQAIADEGVNQSNQLRQAVEQARQTAIGQLYQSADPAQGMASAINAASQIRRPGAFAPLINTFADVANNLALSRLIQGYTQPYGAGLNAQPTESNLAPLGATFTIN